MLLPFYRLTGYMDRLHVYISFKCGIALMMSWLCMCVCVCVVGRKRGPVFVGIEGWESGSLTMFFQTETLKTLQKLEKKIKKEKINKSKLHHHLITSLLHGSIVMFSLTAYSTLGYSTRTRQKKPSNKQPWSESWK